LRNSSRNLSFRLGDHGLESASFQQSIEDYNTCLEIRERIFPPHSRKLADIHAQLACAHRYAASEAGDLEYQLSSYQVPLPFQTHCGVPSKPSLSSSERESSRFELERGGRTSYGRQAGCICCCRLLHPFDRGGRGRDFDCGICCQVDSNRVD